MGNQRPLHRRVLRKAKRWHGRLTAPRPEPVRPEAPRPQPVLTALPADAKAPRLSVVVPAFNVEAYLGSCLDSVLGQTLRDLEVIVVDDCSPDRSYDVAMQWHARDSRVRVLKLPENGGLSHARNTGLAVARGEFLCFLDSDDEVEKDAYARAVESLTTSGSDFAVLGYQRFNSTRRWNAAPWITALHQRAAVGTNAQASPHLLANAVAWSKVYRRSFWDEAGLVFPVGVKYEDQPVSAAAYAAATSIDVLSGRSVRWRAREDGSSISQQVGSTEDLVHRLQAAFTSLEILAKSGHWGLERQRLSQLLANDLPFSLSAAVFADEDYWDVLVEGVTKLFERSEPWMWDLIPPQAKVAYELTLRNDRTRLISFFEQGGGNLKNFPTTVVDGAILSRLPFFQDPAVGIPDHRFAVIPRQRQLLTALRRARWATATRLEVSGWAYIDNVDLTEHATRVMLELRNVSDGTVHRLDTIARPDSEVSRISRHKWCNYEPSGFVADIDVADLVATSSAESSTWVVDVVVETATLTARGALAGANRWGSAGALSPADQDHHLRATPSLSSSGQRTLELTAPTVWMDDVAVDGRTVTLEMHTPAGQTVRQLRLSHPQGATVVAPVTPRGPAPLLGHGNAPPAGGRGGPDEPPRSKPWVVRAVLDSGQAHAVAIAAATRAVHPSGQHDAEGLPHRLGQPRPRRADTIAPPGHPGSGHDRGARPLPVLPRPICGRIPLDGTRPAGLHIRRASLLDRTRSRAPSRSPHPCGTPQPLPLPLGRYVLSATRCRREPGLPVEIHPSVTSALPELIELDQLKGRLERTPRGELQVTVDPALLPDERGARQQRELQDWHQQLEPTPRPEDALFRSYYGENTACNAGAVHAEPRAPSSPSRSTGPSRTSPCQCHRAEYRSSRGHAAGTSCCATRRTSWTTCTSRRTTPRLPTRSWCRPSTATPSS